MNHSNLLKQRAAKYSVISNFLLVSFKLFAGILSGSVSIISEAIHSGLDLIASIIAFISVKLSSSPPDSKHQYGHGKFENISGVIEALLIFVAAIWIIYEAIEKIYHPQEVSYFSLGILVMTLSAITNFFISRYLYRISKATDSIALEADALHLKTDVYTSAGVALGILAIWITKEHRIDSVIAILVALLILKESFHLLKKAFNPLMDSSLSVEEISIIENCISKHSTSCISWHQLRTRKSGSYKYVDFHLVVPGNLSVDASHDLCNIIEKEIETRIPSVEVTIHIEPCDNTVSPVS